MALGSIMNSMWDAWAKIEKKPLWKLLIDLHPEDVVNSIDWRYLEDALTKDEAIKILREKDPKKLIPPLHGALLKNEQDVHLFERIAFISRRENENAD